MCRQPSPGKRQHSELQSRDRTLLKCELSLVRASQQTQDTAQTQGGGQAAFASTVRPPWRLPHMNNQLLLFVFISSFTRTSQKTVSVMAYFCQVYIAGFVEISWGRNYGPWIMISDSLSPFCVPGTLLAWLDDTEESTGLLPPGSSWHLQSRLLRLGASKRDTKPSGQLDDWSIRCPSLKNPQIEGMAASIKGV